MSVAIANFRKEIASLDGILYTKKSRKIKDNLVREYIAISYFVAIFDIFCTRKRAEK